MGTIASQITSLAIVYSTVYSGADQRKHQSSASLAFVREIHRWRVNFPHKRPVTRKMFQFNDVIMKWHQSSWRSQPDMYVMLVVDQHTLCLTLKGKFIFSLSNVWSSPNLRHGCILYIGTNYKVPIERLGNTFGKNGNFQVVLKVSHLNYDLSVPWNQMFVLEVVHITFNVIWTCDICFSDDAVIIPLSKYNSNVKALVVSLCCEEESEGKRNGHISMQMNTVGKTLYGRRGLEQKRFCC